MLSFPLLGQQILPIGIFGLFITGVLATIMSTVDSLSLISAITIGRDILWQIQHPQENKNPVPLIRRGLIIIALLSLLLSLAIPSVVGLLYAIGSILIPGLILPFLWTIFLSNIILDSKWALSWILFPVAISFVCLIISKFSGKLWLDL